MGAENSDSARRTYGPHRPKRLIVELITALLQRISEAVIALFTPGVYGYVFLVRTRGSTFKELPFFILEIVVLFETEECHPKSMDDDRRVCFQRVRTRHWQGSMPAVMHM